MATISINIQDDMETKLNELCQKKGISITSFFINCAKKAINEKNISYDYLLNEKLEEVVSERLEEVKNPENLSPEFSSMKEASEWIHA